MRKLKRPGIFISHNHEDKEFARRIADDLRRAGANVWIDEAVIELGDSLIEKIKSGIDDMDYLAVILSPNSVKSKWVLKEVRLAYEQEIEGKRVKVLPLLYKECKPPKFLGDKLGADFSLDENYERSLGLVIKRLRLAEGDDGGEAASVDERLERLSRSSRLLAVALEETAGGAGPSESTVAALIASPVPEPDVEKFWLLLARKFEGAMRLQVARTALRLFDAAGVGGEAIDFCLDGENLNAQERETLGMHMQYVTSEGAVVWCHRRMVSRVKSDTYYNSFLQRHAEIILRECYDEMASYLLSPDRGPRSYNVDSLFHVAERADDAGPFIPRLKEWFNAGLFDGRANAEGAESGELLYVKLNRAIGAGRGKFDALTDEVVQRVHRLLDSRSENEINRGLYHLVAMTQAKFLGVDRMIRKLKDVYIPPLYREQLGLFEAVGRALRLLSRMNGEAGARPEPGLRGEFEEASREVYRADNITGFWERH